MKRRQSQKGFSLVELLVSTVIAAIILMTVWTSIYYLNLSVPRHSAKLGIQKDGSFVMDAIAHTVRPAASAQVAIAGGGSTLLVGTESYAQSGSDLVYTDSGGNTETLISNVTSFTAALIPAVEPTSVQVQLVLTSGDETITLDSDISMRN